MTKSRFCFGGGLLGLFHKGLLTRQQCTSFFFMCEGIQLLHIWMLQLCSAARCQELQKMVKSPDFSHRSTETSEILFLFSPLMLSSRSRLSRKLNTHSILAFSAVNSDPPVGVRSLFYTKNENFYTRANQYKKHRTGKKVQSFQQRLAVKTKVTETLTDLPQKYICCCHKKKKCSQKQKQLFCVQ